jgi:hypothetical protein
MLFGLEFRGGFVLAQTLSVPFDFSRSEIEMEVTVKGERLHVLLDTGVDPSVIDLSRAEALGLKVDRRNSGELDGFGDAKGATAYAVTIEGLAINGRRFGPVQAATTDLTPLAKRYRRPLDGVLGFSFLHDKIVLIDYPGSRLLLLDRASEVTAAIRSCRKRWSAPMRLLEGENWPLIPDFRFGREAAAVTLDTGGNGSVTLYRGALDLPGVRSALVEKGQSTSSGFRGDSWLTVYVFNAPMSFGLFELPPGQTVTLRDAGGSADVRANVGNKLFAAMKLKMLLNYRSRTLAFYGDCR